MNFKITPQHSFLICGTDYLHRNAAPLEQNWKCWMSEKWQSWWWHSAIAFYARDAFLKISHNSQDRFFHRNKCKVGISSVRLLIHSFASVNSGTIHGGGGVRYIASVTCFLRPHGTLCFRVTIFILEGDYFLLSYLSCYKYIASIFVA